MSAIKKTYSSVFCLDKLSTNDQIIGAGEHNLRTKRPRNADPKRAIKNQVLVGAGQTPLMLVNQRISKCEIKPRRNAVRAIEIILSAGPKFFKNLAPEQRQTWVGQSMDFIRAKFGKDNLVHAVLHDDETTLHLHAIVVPVVPANDKDGRVNKRRRKREWKLDAKGILEQMADLRPCGDLDRAAAEFRQGDLLRHAKLASQIKRKATPITKHLAGMFPAKLLAVINKKKATSATKLRALVEGLNHVLEQDKPVFDPVAFASVSLSPDTQQLLQSNPVGDDLYRLNRRLLDEALPTNFQPMSPRPIGSPTAPFMHFLQEEYFKLCRGLDPQISEPLYRAKIAQSKLAEFYARLEQATTTFGQLPKVEIQQPGREAMNDPKKYVEIQEQRVKEQLRPVYDALRETLQLRSDLEKHKDAIRLVNQANEKTVTSLQKDIKSLSQQLDEMQKQNDALKAEKSQLLQKSRSIPLVEVMQKLAFPKLVPDTTDQYRLPDHRVIQIDGSAFRETTGGYGSGSMSKRQSGKGAIDLAMFVTGWGFDEAQRWLNRQFGLEATLSTAAEITRQDSLENLQKPAAPTVLQAISEPAAIYYQPNESLWPAVKNLLMHEYKLPSQVLDALHQQNRIHANSSGDLVGRQFDSTGQLAVAVIQPVKAGAKPQPAMEFEIQPGFIFELGNPSADDITLASSLTDTIANHASQQNASVLLVQSVPPTSILKKLANHARHIQKPVLLAGNIWPAEIIKTLQSAGVAVQFQDSRLATTLAEIESKIWAPVPAKWPLLQQKMVQELALDDAYLNDLHQRNLIWATDALQLAARRTDFEDPKQVQHGVTLTNLFAGGFPSTPLVADKGGFFWLGTKWADAAKVVILANPLETISYHQLIDVGNIAQDTDANGIQQMPMLISVDNELPPPELVRHIIKARKKLVIATNSSLLPEALTLVRPDFLVGGRFYEKLEFKYATGHMPEKSQRLAWNSRLVEIVQANKSLQKSRGITPSR